MSSEEKPAEEKSAVRELAERIAFSPEVVRRVRQHRMTAVWAGSRSAAIAKEYFASIPKAEKDYERKLAAHEKAVEKHKKAVAAHQKAVKRAVDRGVDAPPAPVLESREPVAPLERDEVFEAFFIVEATRRVHAGDETPVAQMLNLVTERMHGCAPLYDEISGALTKAFRKRKAREEAPPSEDPPAGEDSNKDPEAGEAGDGEGGESETPVVTLENLDETALREVPIGSLEISEELKRVLIDSGAAKIGTVLDVKETQPLTEIEGVDEESEITLLNLIRSIASPEAVEAIGVLKTVEEPKSE